MRKLFRLFCAALTFALIPLLLGLRESLPADHQGMIEKKYAGWSGVLRLWCFEGWPAGQGSASAWLSACVSAYEKAHPGVYIQVDSVDGDTLRRWNDGTLPPPDLLLFPPGLLADPAGLSPLRSDAACRRDLLRLGDWDGICYALPVALGGYARLEAGADAAEALVPTAEPFRLWAVADASMDAPTPSDDAPVPAAPELDLGLPASATPRAAWRRFAGGEAGALVATQREVVRLSALRDQGKGPEWRVAAVSPFTDQLLFIAVPRGDTPERQAFAAGFATALLGEGCQWELHRSGLFPTTSHDGGYGAADPLGELAARLRQQTLAAPRAFGTTWIEAAERLVRETSGMEPGAFTEVLRHALE